MISFFEIPLSILDAYFLRQKLYVVAPWGQLGAMIVLNVLRKEHRHINKCVEVVLLG